MSGSVFLCEYLSAGGEGAVDPSLLGEGRAMRDAIAADLVAGGVPLALAALPGERVPFGAGAVAVASRPGQPLEAFVAEQASRHDRCWIVAPETGGVLARLHRAVAEAAGPGRWIGCDARSIALAGSKRATLERLASHGIATPRAFAEAAHWVVKPDDGAGGLDTRRHADREAALADLCAREAAGRPSTLEPWVEGEALSLSLLVRRGASVELLALNRQDVRVEDAGGRVDYRGVTILDAAPARDERLVALARAVVRAMPGLAGFVGIDVVRHATRGPVVIEVNPRVTAACVGLSAALGRNLACEIVRDAAH